MEGDNSPNFRVFSFGGAEDEGEEDQRDAAEGEAVGVCAVDDTAVDVVPEALFGTAFVAVGCWVV